MSCINKSFYIAVTVVSVTLLIAIAGCTKAKEVPPRDDKVQQSPSNTLTEQSPPSPSFFTTAQDGSLRAENAIICTNYAPDKSVLIYGLSLVSIDGFRIFPLIFHHNLDDVFDNAVFSPEGKRIAFADMNVKHCHVYIANVDGSDIRVLTPDDMLADEPAFSPDGTKVAFESYWDNEGIWIINIDGTGLKRLISGQAYDPCFSPDGKKIAYSSPQNHSDEIYIMNVDGTNRKRLTRNNMEDFNPVFSPDGIKIVFESGKHVKDEGIVGLGIYIMNVDGTGRCRLTSEDTYDSEPVFSPDGRTIAFVSTRDMAGLNIMNADGTERHIIAPREIDLPSEPSFSPMRINGVLYDTYGHLIKE